MKIYINNPNEGWVVDRFRREFCAENPDIVTENVYDADVIWIIAPWTWRSIPKHVLHSKKVVCTIHHIVPDKFTETKHLDFLSMNEVVDLYHVPSLKTEEQVSLLTKKKIWTHPFWVNEDLWFSIENKEKLREKYNLPKTGKIIGSFQRDTEGHNLKSPKLEKGPDVFCSVVEKIHKDDPNTTVLLAGWRRQYVMERLGKSGIKYSYFELPSFEVINELYNCLDLYIVGSRHEGGPQAIFECALTKTPIVSTDVGAASLILHEDSLFEIGQEFKAVPNVDYAYSKVSQYDKSNSIVKFVSKFTNL